MPPITNSCINLGVEIEENSELGFFELYKQRDKNPGSSSGMEAELGEGNKKPEILEKLAQMN